MSKILAEKKFKETNGSTQPIPKRVIPRRLFKNLKKCSPKNALQALTLQIGKKRNACSWRMISDLLACNELTRRELLQVLASAQNLREIYLYSHGNSRITVKSLHNMIEAFKFFPSWQFIELSFTGSYLKLTDKYLDVIRRGLKKLKLLKRIALSFHSFDAITDFGLQNLSKLFKTCNLLQRIELNFPECWRITDQGLYDISKSLSRLICLQEIKLNFQQCENITENGFEFLATCMERLICLKRPSFQYSLFSTLFKEDKGGV